MMKAELSYTFSFFPQSI